jgi:ubiquinone/menaquinone biosynthesis C-methylase UbiE
MGSADALVPYVMKAAGFGFGEVPFNSFLDCACGYGKWGFLTAFWLKLTGRQGYLVGCDIWLPYLEYCREHRIYDDQIRCDVRAIPFRAKSFDVVYACEVLEHLRKSEGRKFIEQVHRIAVKKLIVTTPNGMYPQNAHFANEFQKHRSAWVSSELQQMGFKVVGVDAFPPKMKFRMFRFIAEKRVLTAIITVVVQIFSAISVRVPRVGTLLVATRTYAE